VRVHPKKCLLYKAVLLPFHPPHFFIPVSIFHICIICSYLFLLIIFHTCITLRHLYHFSIPLSSFHFHITLRHSYRLILLYIASVSFYDTCIIFYYSLISYNTLYPFSNSQRFRLSQNYKTKKSPRKFFNSCIKIYRPI